MTLEALEDRTVLSTLTWTGATNNDWATAGNWSPVQAPGAADDVVFSSGAISSTVSAAATVKSITITNGYTGTITLNANLTDTAGFSQAGGTFNVGAFTLTSGKNFTVSGGTFTPGTGKVVFNNGPGTINASAVAFHDVTIDYGSHHVNVGAGLDVNGALVIDGFNTLTGDIHASGNVTTNTTVPPSPNLSSGSLIFDGNANQTLTGTAGGRLPNVVINKTGGTLSLVGAFTVIGDWTNTNGAVNAGTSTITFKRHTTINTGTTTLNDVVIDSGSNHFIATKLKVGGDLTIKSVQNIFGSAGAITVAGDLTSNDAIVGGTADITLVTSTAATITGGDFPDGGIIINKGSSAVVTAAVTTPLFGPLSLTNLSRLQGTFHIGGNVTTSDPGVSGNSNGDPVLIFDGTGAQTLTASVDNGQVPGLEFNKTTGSFTLVNNAKVSGANALGVTGGWIVDATNTAPVNLPAGTRVKFVLSGGSGSRTIDTGGSVGFNDVELASGSGSTLTIPKMIVNGLLNITNVGVISGTIDARGNVWTSDLGVTSGPGTILFNGTGAQTLEAKAANAQVPSVKINKPSGTLTLASTNVIGVTGDWTYVKGTVDVTGSTIAFQGFGSRTVDAGSSPKMAFNNVEITKGSGDTLTITNLLDVNGSLKINQVGVLNAALGAITVAGDLTSLDTYVGGSTNITMDTAANATITGGDFPIGGIIINKLSGSVVTANVTTPLRGPLSLINLNTLKGTFQVAGDVTTSDNSVGGNADSSPVLIFKGSGNQTLKAAVGLVSGNPAQVPGVEIYKSGGKLTLDWSNPIGVIGSWIVDAANNSTFQTTNSTIMFWTYSDPTINTGTGPKPMTFNNVVLGNGSGNDVTVTKMVVDGDLKITNVSDINGADIQVRGDVTTSDNGVGGTSSIRFEGNAPQSLTATTAYSQVPNVKIAKDNTPANSVLTLGANAIGVTGNWTYTSGKVDLTSNNSTVAFVGGTDATLTTGPYSNLPNEGMGFDNVELSKSSGTALTIPSGSVLTVLGDLNITNGASINGTIQMIGAYPATLTAAGGNFRGGDLVIGKNIPATVTLGTNLSNVKSLSIDSGTFDIQANKLTVAGPMTIGQYGTLAIVASQNNQVTVNGNLTFVSGSKINITSATGLPNSGNFYDVIVVLGNGHSLVDNGVTITVPSGYTSLLTTGANGKLKLTKN